MEKDEVIETHSNCEEDDEKEKTDDIIDGEDGKNDDEDTLNEKVDEGTENQNKSVTSDDTMDTSGQTSTNDESNESEVFQEDGTPGKDKNEDDYGKTLLQDNIYYEKEIQVRPELINSLTEGFTEKFLPSLEKSRKTIEQIRTSQSVLIETVQQENAKFQECQALEGLSRMMTRAKVYHGKLLKIRKDMTALHERSAKLKKRALRLQQQKQKEELTLAQQKEDEYEKEKMLRPRIARSPDSPS